MKNRNAALVYTLLTVAAVTTLVPFDWMVEKRPDAALFEKYLPHAISLGLGREWAKAFESILQEMPRWYSSASGSSFSSSSFGNDIVSISDSLGSSAGTPPRSSGSGGSSGGGSGGGGGGSW